MAGVAGLEDDIMAEIEVKDLTRRMDGAIEALKREFAGDRAVEVKTHLD